MHRVVFKRGAREGKENERISLPKMKRNCSDHRTVMGDPVNFPSNILFLETVSVRITRARSNRECILLLSIPPLPFEFLSQLCTNLHAPWTSLVLVLLARCVCVDRSSFLLEYPLRVPGIRIPPGAKKGASCFHLKVPGHSAIFPLSFPRVFLSHHRHFRGHEDLFARRARGNNFHVPFVFASRPCSRYPNSRSQAFPSRSFSFNRGRGGTRARCLRHVHLEIPPSGLN